MSRALPLLVLLLALPAAAQPVSREEEERMRALEAEREAIVEIALPELLATQPETFHGPLGRTDRATLDVVNDLLLLDWTLALLTHGGAENLDRLRGAALAARRKQVRDAAGWRNRLEADVRPSTAEQFEAGRTAVPLREILSSSPDKPADDAALPPGQAAPPTTAGGLERAPGDRGPAAPLDYIPISNEELLALRDKHKATNRVQSGWIEDVANDPLAEARWRAAAEAQRQKDLRRTTQMKVDKGASYTFGEWIFEAFSERDPVRLFLIALGLLVLVGGGYAVVLFTRRGT